MQYAYRNGSDDRVKMALDSVERMYARERASGHLGAKVQYTAMRVAKAGMGTRRDRCSAAAVRADRAFMSESICCGAISAAQFLQPVAVRWVLGVWVYTECVGKVQCAM